MQKAREGKTQINSSNYETLEIAFVNIHLAVEAIILRNVEWIGLQFLSLDWFEDLEIETRRLISKYQSPALCKLPDYFSLQHPYFLIWSVTSE